MYSTHIHIGPLFQNKVFKIYLVSLIIAVVLQVCHYVFYYQQRFDISLIWSMVDWNMWLLLFLTLFYTKLQNKGFDAWTHRRPPMFVVLLLCFPLLHTVLSNLFFLLILEPSRPFFEDILRQFSKKWFQNIFITIGFYFLFDYFFQKYRPAEEQDNGTVNRDTVLVKDGTSKYQLIAAEIEWIVSAKNYVVIHMVNGEQIMVRQTILSIYKLLKERNFIRISRSIVINTNAIHAIRKRTKYSYSVITRTNKDFPIGKTYLKATQSYFKM